MVIVLEAGIFLYPTGFVPSAVQEIRLPEAGTPSAGVTKVALVILGVTNVRLVTVPVAFVKTISDGVPKLGVVSTGLVKVLLVKV